jgi:hypothetical protein
MNFFSARKLIGEDTKEEQVHSLLNVFGDGSVMLIATFKDNWENRRVLDTNFNKEQTTTSLHVMAEILTKEILTKERLSFGSIMTKRNATTVANV